MRSNVFSAVADAIFDGGTISGDVTINGDLTVNGDGTGNYDEIVDGNLRISSTNQLQFGDTGTYIYQSADGVLDLVSDTEIEINATTIDINGTVDMSSTLAVGSTSLLTGRVGVVTAGDLGVGVHIRSADSGADVSVHADELVIENSGNTGLTILSGTGNQGDIYFGDSGDNDIGQIYYDHSANTMAFITNAAAGQMYLNSSGQLGIGTASPDTTLHIAGTTPVLTIGDDDSEDISLRFDHNTRNFHIGVDNDDAWLHIGVGNTPGSSGIMTFDGTNSRVGIKTAVPAKELSVVGDIYVQQSGKYFHRDANNDADAIRGAIQIVRGDGSGTGFGIKTSGGGSNDAKELIFARQGTVSSVGTDATGALFILDANSKISLSNNDSVLQIQYLDIMLVQV